MTQVVARVVVLERHADGSNRQFVITKVCDPKMTIGELFQWRERKVNDPLNGEFATKEIILTPDDPE